MDISIMLNNVKFNYRVACIFEHDEKILLSQGKGETFWNMPGGRVKAGEDTFSALKREMMEELSINIEKANLINVSENFFTYANKKYQELLFVYHMEMHDSMIIQSQDFYALDNPNMLYHWFKKDEIKNVICKPEIIYKLIDSSKNTLTHNIDKS